MKCDLLCTSQAHHLQGRLEDGWAKVQGNDFYIVPTVPGKCQENATLGPLPPVEFSVGQG